MLDRFLDDYIEELLKRQNDTLFFEQKNLFTKKQYYELLKPVIEIISNNKDCSIEELRELIFKQSNIEENVYKLVKERELTPGLVFSYGTNNYQETVIYGNKQEVEIQNGIMVPNIDIMTEDTIFDLASVTKLFTSLSIMKLLQWNMINLNDEIVKYAPQFIYLKGVTIFDLLSFGVPVKTDRRIDSTDDREKAEQILFNIKINCSDNNVRPYTDMGAMVLKYVIEAVTKMNYYDFLKQIILDEADMTDTYVQIPEDKLNRVANSNYDIKVNKSNIVINTQNAKGIAYDKKAQVMGQKDGILSGHAGLFSTAKDMTNLGKKLINYVILPKELLEMMSTNRTGKVYYEGDIQKYIQYYGFLVYSKNPNLGHNELYEATSGKSFASAGWSGTQITIDPVNKIYFFLGSNRSHNRITYIDETRKNDIITNELGRKSMILPDSSEKIDTTRYSWERGSLIVKPAIRLLLQYKMLEDIFNIEKEKETEIDVKCRKLT